MATKKISKRSAAAKKAAKTRAANKASWDRYFEVDVPVLRMINRLLNHLIFHHNVRVRWKGVYRRKLKHGAEYGVVVKFMNGGKTWRVLIDGYKRPQDYHGSFWEIAEVEGATR